MGRSDRQIEIIVLVPVRFGRNRECRKSSASVGCVIFVLRCPRVVKRKIRKSRRLMASGAVSRMLSPVVRTICCPQEDFQASQFGRPKLERLVVILECPVLSIDESRAAQSIQNFCQALVVLWNCLARVGLDGQMIDTKEDIVR